MRSAAGWRNRLPLPFGPEEFKERRDYHRLIFDTIAEGSLRSTYLPWIESITQVKAGEEEELEVRLDSNYEKVWRALKQRLNEPGVRLKSQGDLLRRILLCQSYSWMPRTESAICLRVLWIILSEQTSKSGTVLFGFRLPHLGCKGLAITSPMW
jgi:hypothetical protein